ncbi:site-specific integrase [Burkholderia vietnamiensis]|uniref:tyrosine-type recombinase/integrase n=1 Tax=Burkholderia vietnamiensis TaxID=60552 RepID=UPI001CF31B93|nr:site-specific integrase [Burkholderia vietnamiensis]MCA8393936.1 site-specific integrase [Burkholderia vietnamiensis]HDR8961663.1 site-specific integrase [Burkholderia vietnamiensis]HDR9244693.1 site-specific integrase [Burkholderia vietnamiensis]
MHLISSTEEFVLTTRPVPGFPIILWEDMRSCEPANAFLRYYLTRGAIGSQKTWGQTGQALYDYFGFLEAHELSWTDTNRGEEKGLVAAYRDYCFEVAKLKRNTVRQRLLYVCEFYKFATRRGWVPNLPFEYEKRMALSRADSYLVHLIGSGGVFYAPSVMPRRHHTLKKFLSKEQVKALLAATDNLHHLMLIRLALHTGMRREELATFPLAYVFDPDRAGATGRNIQVPLDPTDGSGMRTKGSKARVITMSRRFMKELYRYAMHWRGERASQAPDEPAPLFLNQFGQPWANDGKGIEAVVRKIGVKVGIKTYPHMLRHTYATHTLVALQRHRGDNRLEPLVFLKLQLGHASIATTMEYLHIVDELADDAVLAYDDELNDWVEQ